jgi:hypothetical protein
MGEGCSIPAKDWIIPLFLAQPAPPVGPEPHDDEFVPGVRNPPKTNYALV